jgi:ABC-2 type transport system permease protein
MMTADVALTARQVSYENRAFWRNRTRAFWSFGFPLMFLVVFGTLNSGAHIKELDNIPYVTFFLPGILAYGVMTTAFTNLLGGLAIQRDSGLLKRMRGTPLPSWAYLAGRIGSTMAVIAIMAVLTLVLGKVAYGVNVRLESLPALFATLLLGGATFCSLAIAALALTPNAEAGPIVVNVLILPLTFISGIWFPVTGAPDWLDRIAHVFPVQPFADALRHAVLPGAHGLALSGGDLLVLAIWLVIGSRLAVRVWKREAVK